MKKILAVTLFISLCITAKSQIFYKKLETKNDISIKYRWAKSSKEEGKQELRLMMKNHAEKNVLLSFKIDFYMTGILEESTDFEAICFRAGQIRRGKINGIIAHPNLTSNDIKSSDFEWKINDWEVTETEACDVEEI